MLEIILDEHMFLFKRKFLIFMTCEIGYAILKQLRKRSKNSRKNLAEPKKSQWGGTLLFLNEIVIHVKEKKYPFNAFN